MNQRRLTFLVSRLFIEKRELGILLTVLDRKMRICYDAEK